MPAPAPPPGMSYNRALRPKSVAATVSSEKLQHIHNTSHYTVSEWPRDSAGRRPPPWGCHLCPCCSAVRSASGPASGGRPRGPGGPRRARRAATSGRSPSGGPPGSAGAHAATATGRTPWPCSWRVGSCGSGGPAAGLLGLTLES